MIIAKKSPSSTTLERIFLKSLKTLYLNRFRSKKLMLEIASVAVHTCASSY